MIRSSVRVKGSELDPQEMYQLATKAYVARGKDGYRSIENCVVLNDPDASPLLSTVVRNHISNVRRLVNFQRKKSCKVSLQCSPTKTR